MTKTIDEGIVVFHNTHDAIKADNICDTEKIDAGRCEIQGIILFEENRYKKRSGTAL